MSSPISNALSAQALEPFAAAPAATQHAPEPAGDTVELSQSAQVNQLSIQGESAQEISQALGIPLSTVDSDLLIVAASVASTAAAVPAPAAAK